MPVKFLERVTGLAYLLRKSAPLRAEALGRIPENCPLGSFLTEFHLIGSSPYTLLKKETGKEIILACEVPGAGDGTRTRE